MKNLLKGQSKKLENCGKDQMLIRPLDENQYALCYRCREKATHISQKGVYVCTKQLCIFPLLEQEEEN